MDEKEMALSESNSKFIFYCGQRETTRFENIPETINRKRKAIERQLIARAKALEMSKSIAAEKRANRIVNRKRRFNKTH